MDEDEKEFTKGQTDFKILVEICLTLSTLTGIFLVAFAELHMNIFLILALIVFLFAIITAILAIMKRRKMNKPSLYSELKEELSTR